MTIVYHKWHTESGDQLIANMARISNPNNRSNPNILKLIKYCADHAHWSIFEMASMAVEIQTTRAISHQIVRHKSFSFQEYSQRYAAVPGYEVVTPRRQDTKNRQNSIDDLPEEDKQWFIDGLLKLQADSLNFYNEALKREIAKECARFALLESATTRLCMAGTVRSWIHYLQLRTKENGTQLEHTEVSEAILPIFAECFPIVYQATFTQE